MNRDGYLLLMSSSSFTGHEDNDWLSMSSYADADLFLMCFSIDNPTTLDNIEEKWIPDVQQHCPMGMLFSCLLMQIKMIMYANRVFFYFFMCSCNCASCKQNRLAT